MRMQMQMQDRSRKQAGSQCSRRLIASDWVQKVDVLPQSLAFAPTAMSERRPLLPPRFVLSPESNRSTDATDVTHTIYAAVVDHAA